MARSPGLVGGDWTGRIENMTPKSFVTTSGASRARNRSSGFSMRDIQEDSGAAVTEDVDEVSISSVYMVGSGILRR